MRRQVVLSTLEPHGQGILIQKNLLYLVVKCESAFSNGKLSWTFAGRGELSSTFAARGELSTTFAARNTLSADATLFQCF